MEEILLPVSDLHHMCMNVLMKAGVNESNSQITADVMIEANIRGIDSHGVGYLPVYVKRIREKAIQPNELPQVVKETETSAVIDGRNGLGQVNGNYAMRAAIEKAVNHGMGMTVVRNSGHFGLTSYYPAIAASQNFIGIAMTNAPSSVAPFGGKEAIFGTNPIAFVFPLKNKPFLSVDFATSAVARTKLRNLPADTPIPEGWALNNEGYPARKAGEGYEGILLPASGVKGYALAIIVEIFSAILSQADFTTNVGQLVDQFDRHQNVGHFFGAIQIEQFMPMNTYFHLMDQLISSIKSAQKAPGTNEIYYPGEIEANTANDRRQYGIPLSSDTFRVIQALM
ncbi:Ldh family oxidoreductase [Neobacillus mesonae]|uniref:Ldh family oxidoreductase n=1 Tax=Neobacillus mesonae TaxID=1193713 RepID=UPI00203A7B93|nr:Ldh family oxidoreductase [Neobacillus mesonae]MCM3570546.1 Ldh family oxidoreductase [Neobacillus mesonae]